VLLRVLLEARDEARELARYTGRPVGAAVEQAIHDAKVRAYYAAHERLSLSHPRVAPRLTAATTGRW
jgi:hypothetical protein